MGETSAVETMHCKLLAASWTSRAYGLGWAVVYLALIFVLLALAIKLIKKYREQRTLWGGVRDKNAGDTEDPGELLTKFRDLHSRGTLSDGEYRTIKTKLAAQISGDVSASDAMPHKPKRDAGDKDSDNS